MGSVGQVCPCPGPQPGPPWAAGSHPPSPGRVGTGPSHGHVLPPPAGLGVCTLSCMRQPPSSGRCSGWPPGPTGSRAMRSRSAQPGAPPAPGSWRAVVLTTVGGVRWVPSPHRWAQGTNAPAPRFCLPGCWTRAPLQPPCLFCSLPAFLFLFFSPSVHIPASHFHFLGPGPAFTAESGVVPLQGVVLFGRAQFSLVSGASAVVQALC